MTMTPEPPSGRSARSGADGLSLELPVPGEHAYPSDLVDLVLRRWQEALAAGQIDLTPPNAAQLRQVLSICYQATLLREEGRPVTFRLALSEPDAFEPSAGPPSGLHRLVFTRPLPLDQHELRRLSPAAEFSRSLLGATVTGGAGSTMHGGPRRRARTRSCHATGRRDNDCPAARPRSRRTMRAGC